MQPPASPMTDHFIRANEHFTSIAQQIRPEQWSMQASATPEWTVQQLVEHVIANNRAVEASLGSDIPDANTDEGITPIDALIQSEQLAEHAAMEQTDPGRVVTNQYGDDMSVDDLLRMSITDRILHAWDLAVSIGSSDVAIDNEAAEIAYIFAEPTAEEMRTKHVFGPEVPVPDEASVQDKLLGLTGRTPALGTHAEHV